MTPAARARRSSGEEYLDAGEGWGLGDVFRACLAGDETSVADADTGWGYADPLFDDGDDVPVLLIVLEDSGNDVLRACVLAFAAVALLDLVIYKMGVGMVAGAEVLVDGDESWGCAMLDSSSVGRLRSFRNVRGKMKTPHLKGEMRGTRVGGGFGLLDAEDKAAGEAEEAGVREGSRAVEVAAIDEGSGAVADLDDADVEELGGGVVDADVAVNRRFGAVDGAGRGFGAGGSYCDRGVRLEDGEGPLGGDAEAEREVVEAGIAAMHDGVAEFHGDVRRGGVVEAVVSAKVNTVEHAGGDAVAEEGEGAGVRLGVADADGLGIEIEAYLRVGTDGEESKSEAEDNGKPQFHV